MRGRVVAAALVASVAVVLAGIAFAAIPGADGTISACFKKTTKILRVINAEDGQKCRSDERPLSWNQEGPTGPSGSPGAPGEDGEPGAPGTGTVAEIATAFDTEQVTRTTDSIDWQDLPGAAVSVIVPPGETGTVLARFTAETYCAASGSAANYCSIQVLVDGDEADPAAGSDFAFDSHGNFADSGAIQREKSGLDPGTYEVKVQWTGVPSPPGGGTSTFKLDDWHLTVERIVE